jgi:Mg/Co/Ni transporter MgtE
MEPEEREEVAELLAFEENTAAGRMTNEYLALSPEATVTDAINRLREFEGATDTISTIFLVDSEEKLAGAVPLVALVLATPDTKLSALSPENTIFCEADVSESEVAEMFDKYNLQSLPVVDDKMRLAGIITADDVISILRGKV